MNVGMKQLLADVEQMWVQLGQRSRWPSLSSILSVESWVGWAQALPAQQDCECPATGGLLEALLRGAGPEAAPHR